MDEHARRAAQLVAGATLDSPDAGSILNAAGRRGDPMKHESAVREHRSTRPPPTPTPTLPSPHAQPRFLPASSSPALPPHHTPHLLPAAPQTRTRLRFTGRSGSTRTISPVSFCL